MLAKVNLGPDGEELPPNAFYNPYKEPGAKDEDSSHGESSDEKEKKHSTKKKKKKKKKKSDI